MPPPQGTPRRLRLWFEKQEPKTGDEIEMVTVVSGQPTTVATWDALSVEKDTAWESAVFELCDAYAKELRRKTLFSVFHRRGERTLGTYSIRIEPNNEEKEDSEFDGSASSLVLGLYKQNDTLLKHLITQQNAATDPLVKALEAMQKRTATLEAERSQLVDKLNEANVEIQRLTLKLGEQGPEAEAAFEGRLMKLAAMVRPLLQDVSNGTANPKAKLV